MNSLAWKLIEEGEGEGKTLPLRYRNRKWVDGLKIAGP